MTVAHPNATPGSYNSLQWTGSNIQEFIDNLSGWTIAPATDGTLFLYRVNDHKTVIVNETDWLVKGPYWGTPDDYFDNFDVHSNYEYNLMFATS